MNMPHTGVILLSLCFLGTSVHGQTTDPSGNITQTTETDECDVLEKRCNDGRCIPMLYLKCAEECTSDDPKCPDGTCREIWATSCIDEGCNQFTPHKCAGEDHCYGEYQKCDGIQNCMLGTDEQAWMCDKTTTRPVCPEQRCSDGRCVRWSDSCILYCPDYTCSSHDKCYSTYQRCDGYNDCYDGSDEEHCEDGSSEHYSISWWRYLLIPIGGIILFGVLYAAGCRKNALRTRQAACGRGRQMYPADGRPAVTGAVPNSYPTGQSPGLAGATPMTPLPNGAYPRQQSYPTGPQAYPTQPFYPSANPAYPTPPPAYDAAMSYPAAPKVPQTDFNDADLPKYDEIANTGTYEEIGNVNPIPPSQPGVNPGYVGDNPPENPNLNPGPGRTSGGRQSSNL